jgi:hypothetical protein
MRFQGGTVVTDAVSADRALPDFVVGSPKLIMNDL